MMRPDISLPLVFVENLMLKADGQIPELAKDDRHHLERVLRLKKGDRISISDGKGSWQECTFGKELSEGTKSSDGTVLSDFGNVMFQAAPAKRVGVGFCPLKGGRSDFVVSKLTEVGIDFMTPFFSDRTIVEFEEDKLVRQIERWGKIVRESCMQCKRVHLPEVTYPDEFVGLSSRDNVGHCVIDGDENAQYIKHTINAPQNISLLLVGPEGGWAEGEYEYIKNPVNLGPNVLRSDTAAILAGTLLVQMRQEQVKI